MYKRLEMLCCIYMTYYYYELITMDTLNNLHHFLKIYEAQNVCWQLTCCRCVDGQMIQEQISPAFIFSPATIRGGLRSDPWHIDTATPCATPTHSHTTPAPDFYTSNFVRPWGFFPIYLAHLTGAQIRGLKTS